MLRAHSKRPQSSLSYKQLWTSLRMCLHWPSELPPPRAHDHRIPLIPNALPVNIRPYKHPPMQKDAIEFPSNSPFASPIVMVKKNNTWRMSVDYVQAIEQEYHQRQVTNSYYRGANRRITWGCNLFQVRFEVWLPSNQDA